LLSYHQSILYLQTLPTKSLPDKAASQQVSSLNFWSLVVSHVIIHLNDLLHLKTLG